MAAPSSGSKGGVRRASSSAKGLTPRRAISTPHSQCAPKSATVAATSPSTAAMRTLPSSSPAASIGKRSPSGPAQPITPAFGYAAAPAPSPSGRHLVYVHHYEDRDCLAIVDAAGSRWPQRLVEGADFYMQPAWHPSGDRLAWIEWDHPQMPWDGTRLMLGQVARSRSGLPQLRSTEQVAGDFGHSRGPAFLLARRSARSCTHPTSADILSSGAAIWRAVRRAASARTRTTWLARLGPKADGRFRWLPIAAPCISSAVKTVSAPRIASTSTAVSLTKVPALASYTHVEQTHRRPTRQGPRLYCLGERSPGPHRRWHRRTNAGEGSCGHGVANRRRPFRAATRFLASRGTPPASSASITLRPAAAFAGGAGPR